MLCSVKFCSNRKSGFVLIFTPKHHQRTSFDQRCLSASLCLLLYCWNSISDWWQKSQIEEFLPISIFMTSYVICKLNKIKVKYKMLHRNILVYPHVWLAVQVIICRCLPLTTAFALLSSTSGHFHLFLSTRSVICVLCVCLIILVKGVQSTRNQLTCLAQDTGHMRAV